MKFGSSELPASKAYFIKFSANIAVFAAIYPKNRHFYEN